MNRKIMLSGLVAASLLLPACATVVRGTSQKFNINTTPTEADVKLSTGQTCVSPCQLKLKRKDGFTVTATKKGYEAATAQVESELRGGGIAGGAGNLLIGGVIGGIVDGTNGSMKDLTPNPLNITLKPIATPAAAESAVDGTSVETATVAPPAEAAPGTDQAPAADATGPVAEPAAPVSPSISE